MPAGSGSIELLGESDFVSLHVPLTAETTHLIDARALALMKPTAYLINTSRGPVVDEAALVEALKAGRIAGAGLDVYEREPAMAEGLAECDNAVLLPHLGSATLRDPGADVADRRRERHRGPRRAEAAEPGQSRRLARAAPTSSTLP